MEMVVAVAHIAGSLVAQSILGLFWFMALRWIDEREQTALMQSMALDLGVKLDGHDDEEVTARAQRWMIARYSSELFRNRFSDLCGVARTVWDWLGLATVAGIFIIVLWLTFTSSLTDATGAWLIIPVWLGFAVTSVVFSIACKVITGRYPGQARASRKSLTKLLGVTP